MLPGHFHSEGMDLITALQALAKMRGTSLEYEVNRHSVEWTEARRQQKHPMALTEAERVARTKASPERAREKALLKRRKGQQNSNPLEASVKVVLLPASKRTSRTLPLECELDRLLRAVFHPFR